MANLFLAYEGDSPYDAQWRGYYPSNQYEHHPGSHQLVALPSTYAASLLGQAEAAAATMLEYGGANQGAAVQPDFPVITYPSQLRAGQSGMQGSATMPQYHYSQQYWEQGLAPMFRDDHQPSPSCVDADQLTHRHAYYSHHARAHTCPVNGEIIPQGMPTRSFKHGIYGKDLPMLVTFTCGGAPGVALVEALGDGSLSLLSDAEDRSIFQCFKKGTKVSYRFVVSRPVLYTRNVALLFISKHQWPGYSPMLKQRWPARTKGKETIYLTRREIARQVAEVTHAFITVSRFNGKFM